MRTTTHAKPRRVAKTATPPTITVSVKQAHDVEEELEILRGIVRGRAAIADGRVKTTAEMKKSISKWFK